jgi:hypothetical protein
MCPLSPVLIASSPLTSPAPTTQSIPREILKCNSEYCCKTSLHSAYQRRGTGHLFAQSKSGTRWKQTCYTNQHRLQKFTTIQHLLHYRERSLTLRIVWKVPGKRNASVEGAVEGSAFPVDELDRVAGAHCAEVVGTGLAVAVVGTVLYRCQQFYSGFCVFGLGGRVSGTHCDG